MNKFINQRMRIDTGLQAIILFALMISLLIPSSIAFADDPIPPTQETVTTEEALEDEVVTQGEDQATDQSPGEQLDSESDGGEVVAPLTDPQPGDVAVQVEEVQAAPEQMPEQIVSQLPEGTDLVVVSQAGEIEPLVSLEAEKAIIENDPIWCPDGVTPQALANGCSDSYASFKDLLNSLVGTNQPAQNGVIWIAKDYNSQTAEPAATKDIVIDGNTYKTWRNYSLTLQGGWNGLGTKTVDQSNPSTFSGDTLRILNWQADVTINDLVIDGAAGNAGLMVTTTGAVTIDNVESKNNKNNRGVYIDNDAGTGKVIIVDSRFTDNGNGANDDGLYISSRGSVSLVNVVASGNKDDGVEISNYTSATNASVQIAGTNVFNGNTSDGLYIRSKGAIALENITADGNQKDSGARLDNDEAGAAGGITISGYNSFSGNNDYGLQVYSRGDLDFENVVADNNKTQDGAYLDNDAGTGDIIISGVTSFSGNGNDKNDDGLFITSKGNVSLVDLVATSNRDDGVEIQNTASATSATVQVAGNNLFTSNKGDGLLIRSKGDVLLENLTAEGNGADGVNVTNYTSTTMAVVAITGANSLSGNTSDGLYIRSKGAIALENITADGNLKDSGARLDNDEAGAAGGITISGNNSFSGNNAYGLQVYSRGDLDFENVVADKNKTQDGAYLDNDTGTGDIIISGVTSFSGNGNGSGDDGLYISSKGNVSLVDLVATGNKDDGVEISNYTSATNASVQIAGTNVFNGNTSDGLYIRSKGAIALENITAEGNQKDSGARLDNDEAGAAGGITISGYNSFSGNNDYGLQVYSRGDLDFENVVADNNKTQDGAYLDNDTGTGYVKLTGVNSFSGNGDGAGDDGLYIISKGTIILNEVAAVQTTNSITADNNRGSGVRLDNDGGTGDVLVGGFGNDISNNAYDGLWISTRGNVDIYNLTASGNKAEGVELITAATPPNDANIYCSIFENNGTYGVYGRYARGLLTFQGDTAFSGNTKGAYYYRTAAGVAGFNPDYECDLPDPPSAAPVPDGIKQKTTSASKLMIPVTGGQMVPISCEFPMTTLELTESEWATFVNLCGYDALLQVVSLEEFPESLHTFGSFEAGMTVAVLKDGLPVEVLPYGSEIRLSFNIPQNMEMASFAIVYWDAAANDGAGDWVAQQVPVVSGQAEITVNYTGTFFLVSN